MGNRCFERCGKAERLPVFGQHGCYPANRGKEAHIQHAVGLIEDEDAQGSEIHELAIEEIFEPARSGNHQPGAAAQRGNLLAFGKAADHQSRRRKLLASQRVVLLHDLHGELARGNKSEGRDP